MKFTPKRFCNSNIRLISLLVLTCMSLVMAVVGCESTTTAKSPREAVIKLFGAMERNDKAEIANLLDMREMLGARDRDYALQLDSPRQMGTPDDILTDLTGDGRTKEVWFSLQRVVGEESVTGDSAYVEVTFGNKDSGRYYYNRFGLHLIGKNWRIYSFRIPVEDVEESTTSAY